MPSDNRVSMLGPATEKMDVDFSAPDTRAKTAFVDGPPEIPGYTLTKEIGRGGMGVVYCAHQHALNRSVAIKLLTGSASANPERWVRFRVEAEAIGRLQHPNTVRVFDSGEHAGCPFVVQELAGDGSLAERTDGTPVTALEAASWMQDVASAVEHAHQHGVLHRDIKPSNILFSGDTIKLADFGLAKLTDRTDLTETRDVIGTPAYMAPEQASGNRAAIGPTTDVFSIGIVLYQLLTGVPPFLADTAVETIRLVNDHEPVEPRKLQPNIPRDLSTICLQCLNKDPTARYTTASALVDDLRRFRESKPILAKPPGTASRAIKWSRRHPALASLIGVSLTAATSLLFMWARFTREVSSLNKDLTSLNASLITEKEEAERQRNAAEAVRAFLSDDLLQQANAEDQMERLKELGLTEEFERDPRISTLIRRATIRLEGDGLERRFPDQPEVQMETLGIIGDVFYGLGEHEEAVRLFERALSLQSATDIPTEKQMRLWNYVALQYSSLGRYDEAISKFEWLVERRRESGNQKGEATARHNLAGTYFVADKSDIALQHAQQAASLADEAFGADDPQTLTIKKTLGSILRYKGRYQEAMDVIQDVVASSVKVRGEKHPRTISARLVLAQCLLRLGRHAEAVEYHQRVAADTSEVLGPEHPKTMFNRRELAGALKVAGQLEEAVAEYEQVLELNKAHFGPDHRETQLTQGWLDATKSEFESQ